MDVEIFPVDLGFDRCYLLKADGAVLVDAGEPGKGKVLAGKLKKAGIDPGDVGLLVITHGHWDHIGSAREIKGLTGASIAMHQSDAPWLEGGLTPLSPGVTPWGRVFTMILKVLMPLVRIPPQKVDIKIGDLGLGLRDFGIPGKLIHTPGHTQGSVSVLLDSGEAFVGDLAMNRFPLRFRPGPPVFAVDKEKVRQSWELLFEEGARTIYPSHGDPFPAEVMKKALERW